jgi:thiol:disulfide interchange protein DsbG
MNIRYTILPWVAAMALGLTACSKPESNPPTATETAQAVAPAQAYEAVAAQARGFTVGALMSANPVYVLFDPQCPHCGHLWNAALPLLGKLKFVWAPVAIMGPKSLPQGAALMQATDPMATMSVHEQSVLAGQGGMSASSNIPDDVAAAIKANSDLLDRLGADAVPFMVARHTRSGQTITRSGALSTEALSEFLGLGQP